MGRKWRSKSKKNLEKK
jgi:hypothetical protein